MVEGVRGGGVATDLGASAAASVSVHVVQAQDLEGAEGRGSRLGGDHPSEPGHRPRPHVVVVGANWQTRITSATTQGQVSVGGPEPYLRSGVSPTA